MKMIKQVVLGLALAATVAAAQANTALEAPDALVKKLSQDVLQLAKKDPAVQSGDRVRIRNLIETRVLPHVDFQRMTALTVGRHWRDATPEQQKMLMAEFRALIINTYASAMTQVKDLDIQFKPLRADPADTEVEVKTQVVNQRDGDPIQLNYRLAKTDDGWKIYDVNIMGAWMVETYKASFASEISRGGIDGLIRTLADKNKRLANAKK